MQVTISIAASSSFVFEMCLNKPVFEKPPEAWLQLLAKPTIGKAHVANWAQTV